MKKKNLKNAKLNLNKKAVSNLQSIQKISGGNGDTGECTGNRTQFTSCEVCPFCPTDIACDTWWGNTCGCLVG